MAKKLPKYTEDFYILTAEGSQMVKGKTVNIPEYTTIKAFISLNEDDKFIVTEYKTGLAISKCYEIERYAISNVVDILDWQQSFNENYPTIYETVNQHLDKSGAVNGQTEKYIGVTSNHLTNEMKVAILKNKIIHVEAEIVSTKKEHDRYFSMYNPTHDLNFIDRMNDRIKVLSNN